MAVYSAQGGVDPVGACVGQKGVRVQTVTDELGGTEKIDIIQWNRDPKIFLIASLSPAKIIDVEMNEETRIANVHVDESQAPLAIGKSGVNVKLASDLTEMEINIMQTESAKPAEEAPAAPEKTEELSETQTEAVTEELAPDPVQPQDSEAPGVPTAESETPIDQPNSATADPTASNVETAPTEPQTPAEPVEEKNEKSA
jgi:N utilization substance protein A